jgi:hypothetical protein
MLVIFPIYDDIKLLPYFLRYYSKLGAKKFVCGLYNGKNNPLYEHIRAFSENYDLLIYNSVLADFKGLYSAKAERPGLNRIREVFSGDFNWYCIADLDEFHYFGGESLAAMAREAEKGRFQALQGYFVDRIAVDGLFPDVAGLLDQRFPLACNLTLCSGGCDRKIALARSDIPITLGHHNAKGKIWDMPVEVHHFKWRQGVYDKLLRRLNDKRQQGARRAIRTLPKLLSLIDEGIDLRNKRLNIRQAAILGI